MNRFLSIKKNKAELLETERKCIKYLVPASIYHVWYPTEKQ